MRMSCRREVANGIEVAHSPLADRIADVVGTNLAQPTSLSIIFLK
jgi:hypothetical protein